MKDYFFMISTVVFTVVLMGTYLLIPTGCFCQPGHPGSRVPYKFSRPFHPGRNPGPMSTEETRRLLDKAGGKVVALANGGTFWSGFLKIGIP